MSNIIYEAQITNNTNDEHGNYLGAVETSFKERYSNDIRYFKLCLTEKFFIIKSLDDRNLLNKRSELVSKCKHQSKLLLCNVKKIKNMDCCL